MSVVTSIEKTGPCSQKLTIEVPVEAVEAEMGRVVGKFRKNLNLPGFRRGKVPVSMVHKRFREEIHQEVVDRLLPRYWRQAQAEKNLDPMLPPEIEELELEAGKPMTVVASIDTRPEIELKDYRNFDLPVKETEPSAAEVDEQLDELRRQHAGWRTVERAAARGDQVVGRISRDGADEQPFQVELGAEGVGEELTLTLTGMSAGGSADVPDRDSDDAADRRIEVDSVREQELPPLDDDFAARFDLESVDELRAKVEDELRRVKAGRRRQEREQSLLEQLRQRHPLELPGRVVKEQNDRMVQDYAQQLHARGVDVENADIDWVSIADQMRPEAERRVHVELLLDAIAEAEEIRLDENEFERFLSAVAARQNLPSMAMRKQLSDSGRLEGLRARMLRAQTVGFLLGDDADSGEAGGDPAESAAAT